MEKIEEYIQNIDWITLGTKIIGGIIVLIIGFWFVKITMKALGKLMDFKKIDASLKSFILSLIGIMLKIAVIIVVAGLLGMDLSALATIIGATGLAIGMALQGSLANFAGGTLILLFKPFKVGDYIKAQGEEGVVKQIEIFTTKINTIDNREVIIPNGVLSNGNIINFSSEDKRRVDIVFGVSYDADIKETKEVMMNVLKSCPHTIEPEPSILLSELADSSVNFTTRTWVKTENYWGAYGFLMEEMKLALDKAGIEIPYPHAVEIQKDAN